MKRRQPFTLTIPGRVTEVQVNGRWLRPGTEFSVRGHRGRLRFTDARLADDGTVRWVTGIAANGGGYRSFVPDRVRTVHSKSKLRGAA